MIHGYSRRPNDAEVSYEWHKVWPCVCVVCRKQFEGKSKNANTCSPECRARRKMQLKARAKAGKKKAA